MGENMEIIKDDSIRRESFFERRYALVCHGYENYSAEIRVTDAVRSFFREYTDIRYKNKCDHIAAYLFMQMDRDCLHLNGRYLQEVALEMTRAAHRSFLPAAYICLRGRFYRFMLIDENGCFYLDDGTYLGDDYESIAVSILTGEKEILPVRNDRLYKTLERRGWAPDRLIDTTAIEAEYTKRGFSFFEAARKFFEVIPTGAYEGWRSGSTDPPYLGCFADKCINDPYELRNKLGENLLNIGAAGAERLYISESGMFYAEDYPNEPFAVTDDMYLLMQWVLLH